MADQSGHHAALIEVFSNAGARCTVTALLISACTCASAAAPAFRDLNRNGHMDPYENRRVAIEARVGDLLDQMTLEEKLGSLLHGSLPGNNPSGAASAYDLAALAPLIEQRKVTSFITRLTIAPREFAAANNAVQKLAEQTRLGIPVTISTDPRNHFQEVLGASTTGGGFSLWPETLGLAAIGDPKVTRRFGDTARAEYRAVGIHMALSPQQDLATEPRWPRTTATFGADPSAVSAQGRAYVEGFQGGRSLRKNGVATIAKHWVGYGAEPEGFDGHNYYGRNARLTDETFAAHVHAFRGVLAAKTAGIMPTYVIANGVTLNGQPLEPVGAGFSRQLLRDLLRDRLGFNGIVISDWAITNDCGPVCSAPTAEKPQGLRDFGMPWGVESLTRSERFAKGLNAGVDQFGGVDDPGPLLEAVNAGAIAMTRVDEAVRRVLRLKFELGLFDSPYVDENAAANIVGNATAQAHADAAQRAAQVVLENRNGILPVAPSGRRVWLQGVDAAAARAAGFTVVTDLASAELALIRTHTPGEKLHPHHYFGARQNEGRLDFREGDADYDAITRASAAVPTLVVVDMDRPAILTNVREHAAALVVTFGASDAAVLDVLTGRSQPRGRLPFELPSSMAAVAAQDPAAPDDSAQPLYPRGAGLQIKR
jgi:beta-glucosidase